MIICLGKNWSQVKRIVKLYAFSIPVSKFLDLSFFWKFRTSSPALHYYSFSLYILEIYALRINSRLPPGSQFTWLSVERKFIFKVEKSMNPKVLGCFSSFYNFWDFSWFWDALAINFDLLAWFPARGWSQISLGLNFKLVQVCACPNSFFSGRMFRSRCLGNS